MLTNDEIKNALVSVDPETKRLPHGFAQFARAIEAKVLEKIQAQSEPVMWQFRFFDSHPDTVTTGTWSEWEEVKPRNSYTDTVQDRVDEFRAYIKQGYKYELRSLYAGAAPVQQDGALINEGTKRIAELEAQNKALLEALKSAAEAMDNCFYAVADVALTDDLNDFGATIKQARAAIAQVEGK